MSDSQKSRQQTLPTEAPSTEAPSTEAPSTEAPSIEALPPANILIVCTANICRSPVAAALLRRRLHERGLRHWAIGSAGTWAAQGRSAAANSQQVMKEVGLDISNHRSRIVTETLLEQADLVLCMESGHAEALSAEFPLYADRTFLLAEMGGKRYSVKDPFGSPLTEYRHMAEEVAGLIDKGIDRIIEIAAANARQRAAAGG